MRSLTTTVHGINCSATLFGKIHGCNPNVSEFLQYRWYDWVYFNDSHNPETQKFGLWLGPHSIIIIKLFKILNFAPFV